MGVPGNARRALPAGVGMMGATPPEDDAGLVETDDGIEEAWSSGHVAGPWDPDELALLLGDDA